MEISLDRQQGANAWLTVGIREGKNREIRRAMSSGFWNQGGAENTKFGSMKEKKARRSSPSIRITSYNVCYTKLLRTQIVT